MSNKQINSIWNISLLVMLISAIIFDISVIIDIILPDIVRIIIAVTGLIALLILGCSTPKKMKTIKRRTNK